MPGLRAFAPVCSALAVALALPAVALATPAKKAPSATQGRLSLETLAWQVALDAALFSPGVIDGQAGPKTGQAIREFQQANGLPASGEPDDATRARLGVDPGRATRSYLITAADEADVGPWPKTWPEKAQARRLGYKSLAALVAERGHCSLALLARLNPGRALDGLHAGDTLTIPNVLDPPRRPAAARLEVNLAAKTVRPLDARGQALALFHCSIAKHKEKRPRGRCTVKVVRPDPVYIFDPRMWPEVKGVNRKLVIPPGPRNPVGLFWIGLSLPGYGIHGTPEPELIGKTGSHGCFRLANWDAVRLGGLVGPGLPVEFLSSATPSGTAARSAGSSLQAANDLKARSRPAARHSVLAARSRRPGLVPSR